MSRPSSFSLLGLSLALLSSATFADTVWLTNGDRLTGTIRFFDGSKLLLETDYGGSIPLDWKKIATLQSDHELLVKLGPVDGERAKSLLAAEPGKVTLANGDSPKTIELAQIEGGGGQALFDPLLKRRANLGHAVEALGHHGIELFRIFPVQASALQQFDLPTHQIEFFAQNIEGVSVAHGSPAPALCALASSSASSPTSSF